MKAQFKPKYAMGLHEKQKTQDAKERLNQSFASQQEFARRRIILKSSAANQENK